MAPHRAPLRRGAHLRHRRAHPDPGAVAGPEPTHPRTCRSPWRGWRRRAAARRSSSSPRTRRPRRCSSAPGTRASSAPRCSSLDGGDASCTASPTSRSRSSTNDLTVPGVSFDSVQHLVSAAAGETGPDGGRAGAARASVTGSASCSTSSAGRAAADLRQSRCPSPSLAAAPSSPVTVRRARPQAASGRHPAAHVARLPPALRRGHRSPTSAR